MKVAVGSDHRGYDKRRKIIEILNDWNFVVFDRGCETPDSCDYPLFARSVCGMIIAGEAERGILICGTGIGMSMTANRFPGIRAALCHNKHTAIMSREHNDSNVICLSGDADNIELLEIMDMWFSTEFEGGRHEARVSAIDGIWHD